MRLESSAIAAIIILASAVDTVGVFGSGPVPAWLFASWCLETGASIFAVVCLARAAREPSARWGAR